MSQPTSGRPLPAYVYRRRRLAVFGGLAVFVLVLILIIARPGSGGAKSGGGDSAAVIPATSAPAASTTPSDSNSAAAACTPSQIKVTAYTDAESYAAGQLPQLSMGVENTGNSACTLNVGTSQQVFTITSGSEIYWLSTDCQKDPSDYDLVLQPGQSVKSEPIQWDRTRSNPGTCTLAQRDPVPAGGAAYKLTAAVNGITSPAAAQFSLN